MQKRSEKLSKAAKNEIWTNKTNARIWKFHPFLILSVHFGQFQYFFNVLKTNLTIQYFFNISNTVWEPWGRQIRMTLGRRQNFAEWKNECNAEDFTFLHQVYVSIPRLHIIPGLFRKSGLPWDMFSCSSWWCGTCKRRKDRWGGPNAQPWTHRGCRWSTGKPLLTRSKKSKLVNDIQQISCGKKHEIYHSTLLVTEIYRFYCNIRSIPNIVIMLKATNCSC